MSLNNAQLICEEFLQEQIRRNEVERIVPSESKVARTMLSRGLELRSVYQELEQSLGFDGVEWKVFLEFCVLATGAHWTPEKNIADRSARKRLDKVNEAIAGLADQLAELLEERDEINNRGPFSSDTLYHPVDVIDRASERNGHYQSYLKERLENLCQFDLKYWPSLSEMVRVIATDAEIANVQSHDSRSAAMSQTSRPSVADFVRAIEEGIAENQHCGLGGLPASFRLSDESIAALVNVLLNLPPESAKDAKYVKNIRERDRRRT
ncbi:hypothetical protein JWH11_01250 [Xanthomonas melonis]|uniref:HEPN AbiU2-like domain-containing protein n=1 Tax=Xanthomonas melonis TaxID=56456 RepID=A0ABS8NQF9_9XANT|nr:hypothetical protein [Xanthomonas melonis]MCD0256828.1 hypothetical protein [Xanthomonas melonis]MCD0265086.1 hypothetical protein [Xanthomonas melonis]